jgi:DedD protein
MEIDDSLKNRLAGVAVVTVLAVIFLPMLFEDPVEKKGQMVSELDIPRKPEVSPSLKTAIIPDKAEPVANPSQPQAAVDAPAKPPEELTADTTGLSSSELDVEKPSPVPDAVAEEPLTPPAPTKKPAKLVEAESRFPQPDKKTAKAVLPELDAEYQEPDAAKAETSPLPTGNRRWMIQVASLADQSKAAALRDKLRAQGFPASISEAVVKGKKMYRLKVGPELDGARAQAMKNKINQLNNVKSIAIAE